MIKILDIHIEEFRGIRAIDLPFGGKSFVIHGPNGGRSGTTNAGRIESGSRQPSLPLLARILAAVNLELRITVADYDAHDDILDRDTARLNASQRRERRRAQDEFLAELRQTHRA